MQSFSDNELKWIKRIGYAACAISFLMGITGKVMLQKQWGTPEYVVSLEKAGWTLFILALLWIGLAFYRSIKQD